MVSWSNVRLDRARPSAEDQDIDTEPEDEIAMDDGGVVERKGDTDVEFSSSSSKRRKRDPSERYRQQTLQLAVKALRAWACSSKTLVFKAGATAYFDYTTVVAEEKVQTVLPVEWRREPRGALSASVDAKELNSMMAGALPAKFDVFVHRQQRSLEGFFNVNGRALGGDVLLPAGRIGRSTAAITGVDATWVPGNGVLTLRFALLTNNYVAVSRYQRVKNQRKTVRARKAAESHAAPMDDAALSADAVRARSR
jgi:hypothetical protein